MGGKRTPGPTEACGSDVTLASHGLGAGRREGALPGVSSSQERAPASAASLACLGSSSSTLLARNLPGQVAAQVSGRPGMRLQPLETGHTWSVSWQRLAWQWGGAGGGIGPNPHPGSPSPRRSREPCRVAEDTGLESGRPGLEPWLCPLAVQTRSPALCASVSSPRKWDHNHLLGLSREARC